MPWPEQTGWLMKLAVALAPLTVGLLAAQRLAVRRQAPDLASMWGRLAGVGVAAGAVCILAGLVIWAMGGV